MAAAVAGKATVRASHILIKHKVSVQGVLEGPLGPGNLRHHAIPRDRLPSWLQVTRLWSSSPCHTVVLPGFENFRIQAHSCYKVFTGMHLQQRGDLRRWRILYFSGRTARS